MDNEIGFYIFDYDPSDELIVREHIKFLKQKLNNEDSEIIIKEFDLYEIMLETLENKGYLNKVFNMENQKGTESVINVIKRTLRLTQNNDLLVEFIRDRVEKNDIVFLTGVGKTWPIIRSHTILNTSLF